MGRTRGFDEAMVLDAVRQQFWNYGFQATSTYDLMDATGLAKGSIYHAFGNKRDLYLRVFSDYCDEMVDYARKTLDDDGGSPVARITHYMASLMERSCSGSPRRGCFLSKATADLAGQDADVAALARNTFDFIAEALATAVRAAQSAGEVDPEADARTLGYLLLAVSRGIDSVAKGDVDTDVLRNTAAAAIDLLPKPRPSGSRVDRRADG